MGLSDFKKDSTPKGSSNTQTPEPDDRDGSKEDAMHQVRLSQFLRAYDPRDGTYRGISPPRKSEVLQLDPEDGPWEDEWLDMTGGFEYAQDGLIKKTKCPCGEVAWTGNRGRHARCFNCHRVLVDLEWEDDRVGNPRNEENTGLDAFM